MNNIEPCPYCDKGCTLGIWDQTPRGFFEIRCTVCSYRTKAYDTSKEVFEKHNQLVRAYKLSISNRDGTRTERQKRVVEYAKMIGFEFATISFLDSVFGDYCEDTLPSMGLATKNGRTISAELGISLGESIWLVETGVHSAFNDDHITIFDKMEDAKNMLKTMKKSKKEIK